MNKTKKNLKCTKRNPSPPCLMDYIEKKNKNGINCCYKKKTKKMIHINYNIEFTNYILKEIRSNLNELINVYNYITEPLLESFLEKPPTKKYYKNSKGKDRKYKQKILQDIYKNRIYKDLGNVSDISYYKERINIMMMIFEKYYTIVDKHKIKQYNEMKKNFNTFRILPEPIIYQE